MGKQFPELSDKHQEWIARQKMFFTATAAPEGRVNVSPRSADALRVVSENRVMYLDRIGSANETAAHLRLSDRMTIMMCAVEGPPQIMRLYGKGRTVPRGSAEYDQLLAAHLGGQEYRAARQIVVLDFDMVQTSCGFGVPLFDYQGDRESLDRWADAKSDADLIAYQKEKNMVSLDGYPTGLSLEEPAE